MFEELLSFVYDNCKSININKLSILQESWEIVIALDNYSIGSKTHIFVGFVI